MSDTPRTDAECGVGSYTWAVDSDFARQLERELNAAKERIKQLELELEKARRMYHKAAGEI